MIKKVLLYILLGTFVFFIRTAPGDAVDMDSSQFRIKYGNVNFGSVDTSSTNYDLSTTAGQLAAQEFSSDGYIVKAGFQYWHSIIPFTFSISDITIALGTLTPQTPSTATTQLSATFGGAGSYQVTAVEVGKLRTFNDSNSIADTTCNGGGDTCTETTGDVWTSASTYGFGYNMSGDDVPADFTDATYFRPFPDISLAETPAVVMSSTNVTASSVATVTFKANISNVQAAGTYQTVIKYIATPTF